MSPKKDKKKKKLDDWEADAEVIAQERVLTDVYPGQRLDALFADLIARGWAKEADLDAATDEFASGAKTEDDLIAEWEKKCSGDAFDVAYGFNYAAAVAKAAAAAAVDVGDDDGDAAEKAARKARRWRLEDGRTALSASGDDGPPIDEAEVVRRAHAAFFGEGAAVAAELHAVDGLTEEQRVDLSEASLDEWRRAAADPPKKNLPLPGMTAAALLGGGSTYGVSTHVTTTSSSTAPPPHHQQQHQQHGSRHQHQHQHALCSSTLATWPHLLATTLHHLPRGHLPHVAT